MANVKVEYGCGCGFETKRLEEATEHSDSVHHKMTIRGAIIPVPKPLGSTPRPSKRAVAPVSTPEPDTMQQDMSTIEELRQKFSK